jgi:hypothetical protein
LLHPTVYTEEQFILIDNKASYNVGQLVQLIRAKCDPKNPHARIVMHGHKLHYFQSTARELKTFFGNFIDEKLRELNKIVSTAEQNIQLYNKNVSISNNNLTKNWLERQALTRKKSNCKHQSAANLERTSITLVVAWTFNCRAP